jgi:hypothetical protein
MRTCLVTVVLALAPCIAAAAGPSWLPYVNPRFGVVVEYPALFSRRDPPPENGDGQVFRTVGGDATLRVFGSYNGDGQSASQLMATYRTAGTTYSYSKATKTWFVLSGTKGSTITYMRCDLGSSDVVGCFELDYPASASGQWSPVVDRMSRSLRVLPTG